MNLSNNSAGWWTIERLVALALAFLLLRSAFAHLGNPYAFLSTVYSYNLTGIEGGKWIAATLPALELVLGTALLTGWWKKATHFLAASLFAAFTVAQWLVLRQGLSISCGCFGSTESLVIGPATLSLSGGGTVAALLACLIAQPDSPAKETP
ncbi:MAG: hypothetical protein K2W96_21425 [Gemmataceae bacterium]|nr:hypothetical protein [Gemmataceae bacterium]